VNDRGDSVDSNDIDTGEPIRELRELTEAPRAGFLQRVRNSIHRRVLAADTIDFSLHVLLVTLREYLNLFMQTLFGATTEESERK